jgi:hypothetical protein
MPDPGPHHSDPGELMNVREVHGAIMREYRLPGEKKRRVPWYLHLLYFALALLAYAYLANYSGNFDWNEYEHRPGARAKREYLERQAAATRARESATNPAPAAPTPKP